MEIIEGLVIKIEEKEDEGEIVEGRNILKCKKEEVLKN